MIIITNGELSYRVDGAAVRYRSEFIKEKEELIARNEKFSGWKHSADEADQGAMVSRAMLWGGRRSRSELPTIVDCQAVPGGFYFIIKMTRASGLFFYDVKKDEEIRHFHREQFLPRGFCVQGERLYVALDEEDGASHIYRYDVNGRDPLSLTSGDSRDEHPFAADGKVYYDSAGIARDQQGAVVRFAPKAICEVDERGEQHRILRESPKHDYLMPKRNAAGQVFAIRMPHVDGTYPPGAFLRDLVFFPVNLAIAVVGFLNVFSVMFGKRPLMPSGGPRVAGQDLRKKLIHARVVNIQAASKQAGRRVAAPGDWVLVRLDGEQDVEIERNVVGYSFAADGSILVNRGYSISNEKTQLHESQDLITVVA